MNCFCGNQTIVRTSWTDTNPGRRFRACSTNSFREAEHLDMSMRLRIAMGMAYWLEYLHQLNPPISHKNLKSSSIYLTEDYAAKMSDFSFWDAAKTGPRKNELLEAPNSSPESNVYRFGVILLELITGRMTYNNGALEDWASDILRTEQPLTNIADPTLSTYESDTLYKLLELVKSCVLSDPNQRPTMSDVTTKLKEITAVAPEGAIPRSSPLWWVELEILSSTKPN